MDLQSTILEVLQKIVSVIPSLAVLAATLYYISKRSAAEGYLMAIGALIGLLTHLFYVVGIPLLTRDGVDSYAAYQPYLIPIAILSTLGAMAFAIGLFMLIHKVVTTSVTNTNGPSGY
ncbi:hypothetical protein [Ohtaekwangia koreensis]|uniref:Uncharacterized protein n=1 Tax=Ohtaekwangia koreensis TaxID=688867 RepID=A0A1T5IUR8_9BACT|nr:hypothetical protein [Ohtaekwangia koreensis]SKC42927.1 hypothetical protein SAMN05660236_0437 [Ohtaekwangia koreensis]